MIFESKINLYEKVLKARLNNIEQSKKLNLLKTEVDALLDCRTKTKNSEKKVINNIEDFKKDKLENEYSLIYKEVNQLKSEVLICFNIA